MNRERLLEEHPLFRPFFDLGLVAEDHNAFKSMSGDETLRKIELAGGPDGGTLCMIHTSSSGPYRGARLTACQGNLANSISIEFTLWDPEPPSLSNELRGMAGWRVSWRHRGEETARQIWPEFFDGTENQSDLFTKRPTERYDAKSPFMLDLATRLVTWFADQPNE